MTASDEVEHHRDDGGGGHRDGHRGHVARLDGQAEGEEEPAWSTSVASGATTGTSSRTMAATVIGVRLRVCRSAMERPTLGESARSVTRSISRPPITVSIWAASAGWK